MRGCLLITIGSLDCILKQQKSRTTTAHDKSHMRHILLAESQKGINAIQLCSVENQKGAIAIDLVQQ